MFEFWKDIIDNGLEYRGTLFSKIDALHARFDKIMEFTEGDWIFPFDIILLILAGRCLKKARKLISEAEEIQKDLEDALSCLKEEKVWVTNEVRTGEL